ncbi:MAG: ABC transporter permease [Nocardioidaceae bacterium]
MSDGTRTFWAIARAIAKGFVRDKMSLFFAVVFPLMFLILFGAVFANQGSPRIDLIEIGHIPVLDSLPPAATKSFDASFKVSHSHDLEGSVTKVRKGDAGAVVQMVGDSLVVHYTKADAVGAATAIGTLSAYVDAANVAATGQRPRYGFEPRSVEDQSLKTIQFITPGLLGWAVAMSAAFGAAATLQGWRTSKLLRRLQLSPAPVGSIVSARVVTTVVIALGQMAIFLGLGVGALGLRLTGYWWMGVPLLVCGTLSFMSIGLLAGAIAKTTEGAINVANFIVLPMAFLSGSFFPLDGSPTWLQTVSKLLPLRHLNDGMLDVMVRGEGARAALVPMAILLGFAVVLTAVAARLFNWDAD